MTDGHECANSSTEAEGNSKRSLEARFGEWFEDYTARVRAPVHEILRGAKAYAAALEQDAATLAGPLSQE